MKPFHILTERLVMREWTDDDLPAFQRIADATAQQWDDSDEPEFAEPFIARMKRNQREMGWALWAVELRSPRHDELAGPIGWAGFGTESLPDPELAWTFLPIVWGRGYATEAGIAARDYGFRVVEMPRMVSVIDPRNIASARVAAKVGLVHRGSVACHGVEHMLFDIDAARWTDIITGPADTGRGVAP